MSDIWGHLIGVFIVFLIVAFVGVWVWAWRPRHRSTFDRLSHIPLEGDPHAPAPSNQNSKRMPL